MRVALCISGQPRSLETGYQYVKRNLLDHHKVDVYIHSWEDAVSAEVANRIDELYKPIIVHYTKTFSPKYFEQYTRIASAPHPAVNTGHMLASVHYANELKREWELKCGFKYDIVVRSRFDFCLNTNLPLDDVESGKVYVPNCRIHPQRVMCNDQLAFGSSEVIDQYSQTFLNADRIYKMGFVYNGEDLLSGNLQLNALTGNNMVYVDVNHPFHPGKYNGTPHSLCREDFIEWNRLRG